jgi:hypothetical protein
MCSWAGQLRHLPDAADLPAHTEGPNRAILSAAKDSCASTVVDECAIAEAVTLAQLPGVLERRSDGC